MTDHMKMMEAKLGQPLNVSPDSHYMGSIGAALFALEQALAPADAAARSSNAPVRTAAG